MDLSPGLALQQYLLASYAYYIRDKSIYPDEYYDALAKFLLTSWDTFEHRHKYLVTREDLEAGTLYHLKEHDYPSIVRNSAERLLRKV